MELPKGAFSSWPHPHASRRGGEIARPVSSRPTRRPAGVRVGAPHLPQRLRSGQEDPVSRKFLGSPALNGGIDNGTQLPSERFFTLVWAMNRATSRRK